MNGKTIAELVALAKQSDQQAKEELCRRTYNLGYFTSFKMVKNAEDAEDILHDTYVTLFTKLDQLQENEKFIAWFKVSVSNKTKDYLKKKKPILFTEIENDNFSEGVDFEDEDLTFRPDEKLDLNETQRLIENMLDNLPEEQRMCTLMYYYDQLSVKEIAEALDVSTGTVKSRLNYARQKIKADVLTLESKGTKLYSTAIIPLFVFFLQQTGKNYSAPLALEKVISHLDTPNQLPATKNISVPAKKMLARLVPSKLVAGLTAAVVVITATVGIYTVQKNQNINSSQQLKSATVLTSGDSQSKNSYFLNSNENMPFMSDTVQAALLESGNEEVSNVSVAENDEEFIYEDIFGFSIPFPVEWQGKYTLVKKGNTVGVYYNGGTKTNSVISIAPIAKINFFTKNYYSNGAKVPEEKALPISEEKAYVSTGKGKDTASIALEYEITTSHTQAYEEEKEVAYFQPDEETIVPPLRFEVEKEVSYFKPDEEKIVPPPMFEVEKEVSYFQPDEEKIVPPPMFEVEKEVAYFQPDEEKIINPAENEQEETELENVYNQKLEVPTPVAEKQPPAVKNPSETKETILNAAEIETSTEQEKLIFTFYLKENSKNFVFPSASKYQLYNLLGLDESNQLILGCDDENFIYVSWQEKDTSSPQNAPDDFYGMKEYPVKSEKWKTLFPTY